MFKETSKILLGIVGIVLILLLIVIGSTVCVLCVPSLRTAVLHKGVAYANEKTPWDIELGQLYLSPFHHSPMVLYHAYKGEGDLPLEVAIDSVFVGHRGRDTLLYARAIRVKALARTSLQDSAFSVEQLLALPIIVDTLRLEQATFHSGAMIEAVGVDAIVGELAVRSPEMVIAEGQYPLHALHLHDANVAIDLRETAPDTTAKDTTPMKMAFIVPDGEMQHVRFRLTPLDMTIDVGSLSTDVTADVGANKYDARQLNVGDLTFRLGNLRIPADTIYGNACVDLVRNDIRSNGLHVRSDEMGALADLYATTMDLNSMRVDVIGDAQYQGSKARLRGAYDIDDEAYDMHVDIERVNLTPFLQDDTRVVLAGQIDAKGHGIDPNSKMVSRVKMRLDEAIYGDFNLSHTTLEASTDSVTALAVNMPALDVDFSTPMPLMRFIDKINPLVSTVTDSAVVHALTSLEDLTMLDTIRRTIPAMNLDIDLRKGSPIQFIIDDTGLDFQQVALSLHSDAGQTNLDLAPLTVYFPDSMHLPPVKAALDLHMEEGITDAALQAETHVTDGASSVDNICSDVRVKMNVRREEKALHGEGQLSLDSVVYNAKDLGDHTLAVQIAPSEEYANALRADVQLLQDIPLEMAALFVELPEDIALQGAVRASASIDGLPNKTDISAEVQPLGVQAQYKPYQVDLRLGEKPIVMKHNKVDLNGMPIYAADSTFIAFTGGLDLDSMQMDIRIEADSFAPVKLPKGGPIPVYGDLATDIRGRVTGSLDDIKADVDVTVLPTTDITYPIDKKNLARVKPHGTVNVQYGVKDGDLSLGGRINVDEGTVKYSPKIYPMMPFKVDSGSHVLFNGPLGQTKLNISASQHVKADVQSAGEGSRNVAFTTGVRVNGELDSIGIKSIGFFLEAPEDEAITRELAKVDEGTREGLAATLLATGMYLGESNEAAHRDGYALSAIINSRINAALANSKLGKYIEINLGTSLSENPDINETTALFSHITADYKLTKDGNVMLRLFSQKDYNNVLEGELYKFGLGVRAFKEWNKRELFRSDSIDRVYGLTADAGVAYRTNNSLGPDLTLKSSIKNLFGRGETFTVKGNGAYYWALRNRHPGDPKKTDTYKIGVNAALIFPYLHWAGDHNPSGDTRYMLGYQYENIAGGYGVHKVSGSFTYFIHSPHSPYITHAFTPFSLSVVMMKAESEDLLDKAADYPQLIKVLAGDEFIPSIGYNFIYNDYRAKRAVNTFLNLGVKEAGNILNGIYCAFGHKWDDLEKPLGKITFNQFVKVSAELRNKFNLTDKVSIATRLFAGANVPVGNSAFSPLSEAFYTGGPNSLRASSPYAYGPGNFYSAKYNQNFFHSGDVKLEANFELRFPIVWKLYGAAFVDAGNVWNWHSTADLFKAAGITDYKERLQLYTDLYDGIINNPEFAKQIALGTGAGLRLDLYGLVVRLDVGVSIHSPYQTYKYDKDGKPDTTKPINSYYNIPSALDAFRINFGIGYPF